MNIEKLLNLLNTSGININDESNNINRFGVYPKTQKECEIKYKNTTLLPLDIVLEKHHYYYGNPWIKGLLTMEILNYYGIQKSNKLLEFGCGALRNGIHIIRYLNNNSYFGSDCDIDSLKAAILYELPMNDLIHKNPIIKLDNNFNINFVTNKVDYVLSTAVLHNDMDKKILENAIINAYSILNDTGYFIVTNFDITYIIKNTNFYLYDKKYYSTI